MRTILRKSCISIGFTLVSSATAFAATQEELLTTIFGRLQWYIVAAFLAIVIVGVYFSKLQDRRLTPLSKIFEGGKPIYSVAPNATVTECVRLMTTRNIGAVIVMDGSSLIGIFSERDALNKVLAGGLDPSSTKVSEVMTTELYWMDPTKTVGAAIELMTMRRIRHLPIVDKGKVLAVISSGDLTQWVGRYQQENIQDLADLAELEKYQK